MSQSQRNARDPFISTSAAILDAMANANRLSILAILSKGELSVGALSGLVDLSQSALSQHLSKLRRVGLVSFRREAQTIHYSCHSEAVTRILAMLDAIFPSEAAPEAA